MFKSQIIIIGYILKEKLKDERLKNLEVINSWLHVPPPLLPIFLSTNSNEAIINT